MTDPIVTLPVWQLQRLVMLVDALGASPGGDPVRPRLVAAGSVLAAVGVLTGSRPVLVAALVVLAVVLVAYTAAAIRKRGRR